MGFYDDIFKKSQLSFEEESEKDYQFRIDQIHKMIKERADDGKFSIAIHKDFFEGDIGNRVMEKLTEEGFSCMTTPSLSSFVRGSDKPTIYWEEKNK